jgi:hypothetical protein
VKKNIYIHVGFGKTGTTTIQNFFSRERQALIKEGILYPRAGQLNSGHHLLALLDYEAIPNKAAEEYNKVLKEIHASSCDKIVISSENFCFMKNQYVAQIHEIFNEFETTIIFYYRPQPELIESTYMEWIKTNKKYTKTIDQFFKIHVNSFDFNIRIAPWSNSFGDTRIVVRPYKFNADERWDSQIDFLQTIQASPNILSHATPKESNRFNPSLSPAFCKLIFLVDDLAPDPQIRQKMISQMVELSTLMSNDKTPTLLSPKLKDKIEKYYKKSNKLLFKKYGGLDV